jgi:CRISPR/Cas system CSM-associated protein Csm5 (group 7 of RAMP superfamily)
MKKYINSEIDQLILIGFSGGFRRNEIVSLDYEDLDFVEKVLKLTLEDQKLTNLVRV